MDLYPGFICIGALQTEVYLLLSLPNVLMLCYCDHFIVLYEL